MNEREYIKINITFIDFLFTLVIQFGFQGFLGENWIKAGRYPNHPEFLNMLVFFLGLLTVIFSWYGYHQSITRKPNKDGLCDMFRFMLDVFMLLFYGILLNKYNDIDFSLKILTLVFCLYILWDLLGIIDYKREINELKKYRFFKLERQAITIISTAAIIPVTFIKSQHSILRITLAISIVIIYRVLKVIVRKDYNS